jgi:hypothetical protein
VRPCEWGPGGEAAPEGQAWLLEIECPNDFEVKSGPYNGPKYEAKARGSGAGGAGGRGVGSGSGERN